MHKQLSMASKMATSSQTGRKFLWANIGLRKSGCRADVTESTIIQFVRAKHHAKGSHGSQTQVTSVRHWEKNGKTMLLLCLPDNKFAESIMKSLREQKESQWQWGSSVNSGGGQMRAHHHPVSPLPVCPCHHSLPLRCESCHGWS